MTLNKKFTFSLNSKDRNLFKVSLKSKTQNILVSCGALIAGFATVAAGFAMIFAFASIPAVILSFLWNHCVAAVFGITTLTFWQAWGILIIFGLLFGRGSVSTTKS